MNIKQSTEGLRPNAASITDKVHNKDVFHLWMLSGLRFSPKWDMPILNPVTIESGPPKGLILFSEAMDKRCIDYEKVVTFYEDDFRFMRIWNDPRKYLPKLKKFAGVIMPDFSTCPEFPIPLKMWNTYRSQTIAAWLQREGVVCYPNAHFAPGCEWMLEGMPKHSVIAICGRGVVKDLGNRRRFVRDLKVIVDELQPSAIIYYGSDLYKVLDYPRSKNIPIWIYRGAGRGHIDCGVLDGGYHG